MGVLIIITSLVGNNDCSSCTVAVLSCTYLSPVSITGMAERVVTNPEIVADNQVGLSNAPELNRIKPTNTILSSTN